MIPTRTNALLLYTLPLLLLLLLCCYCSAAAAAAAEEDTIHVLPGAFTINISHDENCVFLEGLVRGGHGNGCGLEKRCCPTDIPFPDLSSISNNSFVIGHHQQQKDVLGVMTQDPSNFGVNFVLSDPPAVRTFDTKTSYIY